MWACECCCKADLKKSETNLSFEENAWLRLEMASCQGQDQGSAWWYGKRLETLHEHNETCLWVACTFVSLRRVSKECCWLDSACQHWGPALNSVTPGLASVLWDCVEIHLVDYLAHPAKRTSCQHEHWSSGVSLWQWPAANKSCTLSITVFIHIVVLRPSGKLSQI